MAKRKKAAVWQPRDYTQFFLMDEPTHTPREIRAEYTRIRDIMMKRANRLEKLGGEAQAEYIRKMMPKLSEMKKDDRQVAQRLAQGRALYNTKAYSVSGIRQIQQELFDATGEIVPIGEVLSFSEFMQSWRLSAFSSLVVPSQDAADLYKGEEYQTLGGSFADFFSLYLSM